MPWRRKWQPTPVFSGCLAYELLTSPTRVQTLPPALGVLTIWPQRKSPKGTVMHSSAKSLQSHSVQPHRRQPTKLPRPWDSPGKNTGVGSHFLLQCMKVKSRIQLLATPWTAAHQAPPSMGFSRQEYWSGVPLPSLTLCNKKKQTSDSFK